MTSLREQLEHKARRRVVVPVQVSDPGDDARRAAEQAENALFVARGLKDTPERIAEYEREAAAARDVLAGHTVDVILLALGRDDWEALAGPHRFDDGDYDWSAILPAALAASAQDESLRDADWWAARVSDWTEGEVTALRRAILTLNIWAPQPSIPKG